MITDDSRFRRTPGVVLRSLQDDRGAVALHLESGQYYGVNEVGTLVWELLESEPSFADIVGGVRAGVDDPDAVSEDELRAFISEMVGRKLVEQTQD